MTWALLGEWLWKLMAARQLLAAGVAPRQVSLARTRDVVRRAIRNAQRPRRRRAFLQTLANCRLDGYQRTRSKASRDYPRKKRHKPPLPPNLKSAETAQRQLAQQLTPLTIAK